MFLLLHMPSDILTFDINEHNMRNYGWERRVVVTSNDQFLPWKDVLPGVVYDAFGVVIDG